MTVDFSEHFWGTKYNGFEVLYQNMKYGLISSKDLAEFFKERSSLEEGQSKSLSKLAKSASNASLQGSFAPIWQILKSSTEKLSNVHGQLVQRIQELVKDVGKYSEDLQKKHKLVKEEETCTIETVQLIQNTSTSLQKAKESYLQRASELEKLQKENASQKDIEKAESKTKKAYEDYKSWVEKYSVCRDEFERKMTLACKHFQEIEVNYLVQMKEFLEQYASLVENNNELLGQVQGEFRKQCSELTIDNLLDQFVQSKRTGVEKPEIIEIEEVFIPEHPSPGVGSLEEKSINGERGSGEKKREGNKSKGDDSPSPSIELPSGLGLNVNADKTNLARTTIRGSKWFLRSRRDKNKEKKKSKKKDENATGKEEKPYAGEEKDDFMKSVTMSAEIDEEGYTVRPKTTSHETTKHNFYSSSDSDSEDEREKRLHVEIKPLGNGTAPLSASVDELRSTVENMTLSPVGLSNRKLPAYDSEIQMKRSQSVSQQIGSSSPLSRHLYGRLSPTTNPVPDQQVTSLPQTEVSNRYADIGDIFSEVGDIQPSLPPKLGAQRNTPTPTSGLVAIPRPASRPRPEVIQRNIQTVSPSPSRTESIGSLDTKSVGSRILGSRGPSPLTISLSDNIPLAVAFHEIVHACFRGTDENQCQVKMTGDMMLSFPAGIIQVFAHNPLPALLTCSVRSSQPLDGLVPNKKLVNLNKIGDEIIFEFKMSALVQFLKEHAELNPHASFFNVDILKYNIIPKPGAGSCPLHLVAFWKCEQSRTDLKIEYKYNSRAIFGGNSDLPTSTNPPPQLLQVQVAAPVDGGVKTMQSKPTGQWLPDTNRACWRIPFVSMQNEKGIRSLLARFEITSGPSSPGTIAAQFSCEGRTLSGCDFNLVSSGYRISLVKKRFVSGKYTCDPDDCNLYRYAVPAENSNHD